MGTGAEVNSWDPKTFLLPPRCGHRPEDPSRCRDHKQPFPRIPFCPEPEPQLHWKCSLSALPRLPNRALGGANFPLADTAG